MSAVPVWTSAAAYLALVRRVLSSSRADRLRDQKISVKAVLAIAEYDAGTADHRTGRNVTTSHETVGRALGISSRLVGTGRRLLEKLHLARTIVRGRWLSPDERTAARELHGGRQTVAASVRVLTMPSPDFLSTTFHLPRSGEVNLSSSVVKKSPTRARARATAATRPQPKKKSSSRPPEAPRDPAWQRFAWHIAREFDLLAQPIRQNHRDRDLLQTHKGSLAGNRHIGTLIMQLQRHNITPQRFSPRSLRTDLQRIFDERHYQPPAAGEIRDRFLHFVWKLGLLAAENLTETTLEAQQRRATEWATRRAAAHKALDALNVQRAALHEQTKHVAAEALKRPTLRATPSSRTDWQRDLVGAALDGKPLYHASETTQVLVGNIFTLDRALTDASWTRTHEITRTTWTHTNGDTITLTHETLTLTTPPLPETITLLACMQAIMQANRKG